MYWVSPCLWIKFLWLKYGQESRNRVIWGIKISEGTRSAYWQQEYDRFGMIQEETQSVAAINLVCKLWVST